MTSFDEESEMKNEATEKKGWIKLSVDSKVYPLATIYSAGYVFLDRAYIYLDREKGDKIAIWLLSKNKKGSQNNLKGDFLNELLNYAHYFNSLKANAEAMKMLMQRALFSAAPSLVQESEEKEIEDLIKELEKEEKTEGKKKAKKKK